MKKLLLGMILLVGGVVGWRALRSDAPDPKLIFDRFWVDHEPQNQNPHDKFKVFFIASEHPLGRFVDRTSWTGAFELFHYHLLPNQPNAIDLLFGHTRERQRISYTARRCSERGFDYCLEISGTSRGVQRYYSKKEWERQRDEAAFVDALVK